MCWYIGYTAAHTTFDGQLIKREHTDVSSDNTALSQYEVLAQSTRRAPTPPRHERKGGGETDSESESVAPPQARSRDRRPTRGVPKAEKKGHMEAVSDKTMAISYSETLSTEEH